MPVVHFSSSVHPVVLFAAAFAALLVGFLSYRATVPPVSRAWRIALGIIRGAALFFIVLLIGEPLLSVVTISEEPPRVAVLLDDSESMSVRERAGTRAETYRAFLSSAPFQEFLSRIDHRVYAFGRGVRPLSGVSADSLQFTSQATDIGAALDVTAREASAHNIRAILLITDGNATVGTSPLFAAEASGIPVFTVAIGDTVAHPDVAIGALAVNSIAYEGVRTPVSATVRVAGLDGTRVRVLLKSGGRVYDTASVSVGSGVREYPLELSFLPPSAGSATVTVEAVPVEGEMTTQNNRASSTLRVLKSKVKVLLVAGAPVVDAGFVRRSLLLNPDFSVTLRTLVADGRYLEGNLTEQLLHDAEALVLISFPSASTRVSDIALVGTALSHGLPVLFIAGPGADQNKAKMLESYLPFTILPSRADPRAKELFVSIPLSQEENVLFKGTPRAVWEQLPPVYQSPLTIRAKTESAIVADVRSSGAGAAEPIILTRNAGGVKSAAINAAALYRWKQLSAGIPESENVSDLFFSNIIRWLTARIDERPVRIAPIKESFDADERIEFFAQVYDESFMPADNADVTLTVASGEMTRNISLVPSGNGRYVGSIDPLPEGEYAFAGSAARGDVRIGADSGAFAVGGFRAEFLETRTRTDLLRQMSAITGGSSYLPEHSETLTNDILGLPSFEPKKTEFARDFDARTLPALLVIVTALLAIEWGVRRFKGML